MKQQTSYGVNTLQALQVGDVLLFVDFVNRKVREITWSDDQAKYIAPDLSALAEHITDSGIVSMAYQRNPDPILWMTLTNGTLISMTYERDQDVIAWARHFTGDEVTTASSSTETTDVDTSEYTTSYIAGNSGMEILDEDFNVTLGSSVAGGVAIDLHPSTGEVAMGAALSVVRRQANGTEDGTHYVPDGGWPADINVVRGVRYTHSGTYLYALMGTVTNDTIIYKFDVITGSEVWNTSSISWRSVGFSLAVDSSDNVYAASSDFLDPALAAGVQQVDANGKLGTQYNNDRWGLVQDFWVDEANDLLLAGGLHTESNQPLLTAKLMAYQLSSGAFRWAVTQPLASVVSANISGIRTLGKFIYVSGDRNAITPPGTSAASVWKLDMEGNIVASYDTGDDCTYLWWAGNGRLVVKGNPAGDQAIFEFNTDLTLLDTHTYSEMSGLFRAEGVMLPAGMSLEDETTTTSTTAAEGYDSVAVIPGETEDEVWVSVTRTIGGLTKRSVEQMQPRDWGDDEDAWFVDSGLKYDMDTPVTTVAGLDHLEGEEVAIYGDGAIFKRQTVANGQVTLAEPVTKAIVGLPFRWSLKPMRADVNLAGGGTKGSIKKIYEVVVSLFQAGGAWYGTDVDDLRNIDFRTTEDYDSPPALFTGDKVVVFDGGFDVEDSVLITGDEPLPATIRALVYRGEVTGR
jgi:hypothetical protein